MDFGLKEIGITFMVGAFTILGFELVFFYLCKLNITGFFRERLGFVKAKNNSQNESIHTMKLAVFIGLSFAIGIVAEDISLRSVDTKLPFGIPSRYASRVAVLIDSLSNPDVTPLAKDLANNGAFRMADSVNGSDTEIWLVSESPKNPCEGKEDKCYVVDAIESLYYFAKNNVYKEANYYDEMKKIQARADFTRSIALISFVYLAIAFILGIVLFLDKYFRNRLIVCLKIRSKYFKTLRPIQLNKWIINILLLTIICLFSAWAYYKETKEFDKRAFGYFSTMLKKEKLSIPKGVIEKNSNLKLETPTPPAHNPIQIK